jgi:hypothetical protein
MLLTDAQGCHVVGKEEEKKKVFGNLKGGRVPFGR